jgi:hypothetical protein
MIIVRPPENQFEYREACEFIESLYKGHDYVEFLKGNPSQLLLALKKETIKGAIGILLDSGSTLPTEYYFNFDIQSIVPEIDRSKVFELSRLGSQGALPLVSLFVAVGMYAKKFDLQYAIACVKPKLLHFLDETLQISVHRIDADVCAERIPKEYSGYFLNDPTPVAIYFSGLEALGQIEALFQKLGGSVKLNLDGSTRLEKHIIFDDLPETNGTQTAIIQE